MLNLKHMMILIISVGLGVSIAVADTPSGWTLTHGEQPTAHGLGNQRTTNRDFLRRYPVFVDDITPNQVVTKVTLTPAQRHQAAVWDLTLMQEKRYVLLMDNRSAVYYGDRHLSPVEVLGLNARTDIERQYYAKLAAKQTAQYLAKNLSWASAFHAQYVALMQSQHLPVLRDFPTKALSPLHYTPVALKAKDQLIFFAGLSTPVKPIMTSLLRSLQKDHTIHLDVYLVGKTLTRDAIEHWALAQNIPPKLVTRTQINLHRGNTAYEKLPNKPALPVLYLVRAGQTQVINTGRF